MNNNNFIEEKEPNKNSFRQIVQEKSYFLPPSPF